MIPMQKAYVQYSKRMATAITVFWCVYRLAALALSYLKPDLGEFMVKMQAGVDDVMMVSIGFYTGNSVIEKGIVGYFGAKGASTETENASSNG